MKPSQGKHRMEFTLVILLLFFVAITATSMFLFRKTISNSLVTNKNQTLQAKNHYVFIANDYTNPFMEQLYEGLHTTSEDSNVSIEYFGKKLSISYSTAELVEMAAKAKVDGIFVVGDESEEVSNAIDYAVAKRIPVITVFQDCPMSKRQCFIGINGYDLGRQYAKKISALGEKGSKSAYLLVDSTEEDTGNNSVYLGIKDFLEKEGMSGRIQLHGLTIKSKTEFTSDEMVRELILDKKKRPDIIICLSSIDTTCAYQATVDYNKVGQIEVLGWGQSEAILTAMQKNLIYATIFTDAKQMGQECLKSMQEYKTSGYVSQYKPVTTTTIDSDNLKMYLQKER